jgi:hypothetical protein
MPPRQAAYSQCRGRRLITKRILTVGSRKRKGARANRSNCGSSDNGAELRDRQLTKLTWHRAHAWGLAPAIANSFEKKPGPACSCRHPVSSC